MNKKIVIIEQSFSLGNPGLKSFVLGLPFLLKAGFSVEVWSDSLDKDLLRLVTWRRLSYLKLPGPLGSISFWMAAHTKAPFRALCAKNKIDTVYCTTGGKYWFADVSNFHFYNPSWWKIQNRILFHGNESKLRRFFTLWGVWEDRGILAMPFCRRILSVSKAIAEDLGRDLKRKNCQISVLPNAVDFDQFSSPSQLIRHEQRGRLNFSKEQTVLLFVSMGHYVRKGFWRAVACLQALRDCGHRDFRFLVVGGFPKKLNAIQCWLDKKYPDWKDWIVFTGMVNDVSPAMSAADALFFPSYFEAFSLVEIEAAAQQLPLLLTRHHGSEMILHENVNGLFLPEDIQGMGLVLLNFRAKGLGNPGRDLGEALTPEQWAGQFATCVEAVHGNKRSQNSTKRNSPAGR